MNCSWNFFFPFLNAWLIYFLNSRFRIHMSFRLPSFSVISIMSCSFFGLFLFFSFLLMACIVVEVFVVWNWQGRGFSLEIFRRGGL
ncbi:hypothetical protein DFH27DRAFT_532883 [Peziza echinospora]|nr:hypothetical protein DFH27DRAFT_532883 [Peziza echinospora]